MDSIFRLDSKGHLVIEPSAVKLIPAFGNLTEPQVRYLVLAYDTANTIFKQQKYSEWSKLACKYVFSHDNVAKEEKVISQQIVDNFKLLVYDEDRIQKAKMIQRKRELHDELLEAKGSSAMKAIVDSIAMLDNLVKTLDSKISSADEEVILANKNGKLSMIEKWQRKLKMLAQ